MTNVEYAIRRQCERLLKLADGAADQGYPQDAQDLRTIAAELSALAAQPTPVAESDKAGEAEDAARWRWVYDNCSATWEPAGNGEAMWDIVIKTKEPPQTRFDQLVASVDAARAVPVGERGEWVLVPRKITRAMHCAWMEAYDEKGWSAKQAMWEAVIAAAPEQPAAESVPAGPAALRDIAAERRRQVEVEGWTPTHDDKHEDGSMALAAACYACNVATWFQRPVGLRLGRYVDLASPGFRWPWATKWWKPKSPRQDLVRAGALIVAEIERLDRLATTLPASVGAQQ